MHYNGYFCPLLFNLRTLFGIILTALLLSTFFSCKKDHRVLGTDVQPASDELNAEYISGLPVTAHSLPYDSIASFDGQYGVDGQYKFIGSNNDPIFGRSDIGLYVNSAINDININFGDTARITSAEMVFAIDNLAYAGDKNAVLNYSIFPVTNALIKADTMIYYTSNNRNHGSTPICTASTGFTVAANGQTILRILIDSTYAESILHDTPNLTSNDTYRAKYKGYYIAASLQGGSEGVIYKADLDDDLSGFYLHYRRRPTDTISFFKFPFTGATVSRYNTVKFLPSPALQAQFADSTLGSTDLYIKGMGVSKLKVEIPFLKNYTDSFKVAVNRAELIFNVDPLLTSTGNYLTPPKLILLSIDSIGRETFVRDVLNTTDYVRFNGAYDADNNRYVFDIAREAQAIFNGQKANRGFYLVASDADLSLLTRYAGSAKELLSLRRDTYYERVVLAGNGNMQLKPTFNLNYIRFKNE